jgi:hypothetical protein
VREHGHRPVADMTCLIGGLTCSLARDKMRKVVENDEVASPMETSGLSGGRPRGSREGGPGQPSHPGVGVAGEADPASCGGIVGRRERSRRGGRPPWIAPRLRQVR